MQDILWSAKKDKRKDVKDHIRRFLLYPEFWIDTTKHIGIPLKWKKIKFREDNFKEVPTNNGIYCFVVVPPIPNLFITRYLFYIGKASTTSLRSRYKNYIDEKNGIGIGDNKPRVKVEEMLNEYFDHIYFFYSTIDTMSNIVDCEDKLLNTFYPYVNTDVPEATINPVLKHIY